jgi:hypothetical protein
VSASTQRTADDAVVQTPIPRAETDSIVDSTLSARLELRERKIRERKMPFSP